MNNFYKTKEVMIDLKKHIQNHEGFSIIRTGDGGLKFIDSVIHNQVDELLLICEKEGIPYSKCKEILELWQISINISDYVDTPKVYFDNTFWPRIRKNSQPMHSKTQDRIKKWKEIYEYIKLNISKYCNPEINFLMCLNYFKDLNLLEILKDKKICIITCNDKIESVLDSYDIDILKISGFYGNQFRNDFEKIVTAINEDSKKYDIWLIAAGELGRIYPGLIKYRGGVAIDIGSLVDYWTSGQIPVRLELFMKPCKENKLKLDLTNEGRKFKKYI